MGKIFAVFYLFPGNLLLYNIKEELVSLETHRMTFWRGEICGGLPNWLGVWLRSDGFLLFFLRADVETQTLRSSEMESVQSESTKTHLVLKSHSTHKNWTKFLQCLSIDLYWGHWCWIFGSSVSPPVLQVLPNLSSVWNQRSFGWSTLDLFR